MEGLDAFLKGETEHLQIDDFILYREGERIVVGGLLFKEDKEGKRKGDEKKFDLRERLEIDVKSKKIISINQPIHNKDGDDSRIIGYSRFDGIFVSEKTSKFDYDQFEKEFGKNYRPVVQVINGLNESYNPSSR